MRGGGAGGGGYGGGDGGRGGGGVASSPCQGDALSPPFCLTPSSGSVSSPYPALSIRGVSSSAGSRQSPFSQPSLLGGWECLDFAMETSSLHRSDNQQAVEGVSFCPSPIPYNP